MAKMISHQHQCIFIHIPKCAGTSIEATFGHYDGYRGRGGVDHRSVRMIEPPTLGGLFRRPNTLSTMYRRLKHRRNKDISAKTKLVVTREQYRTYFKFTVVRNPWARVYSWFRNVKRDQRHQAILGVNGDIDFPDFVRRFAGTGMLRPQTYWLESFSGKIELDQIVRFERLAQDWDAISRRLGVTTRLPHQLSSGPGDYREHYCADLIAYVGQVYAREIAIFGYQFGT